VDVTPLYQKELLHTFDSFLRAHNRLKRWSLRVGIRVDQCLLCLRRIARTKWDNTDLYLVSHSDLGDAGWLVPLHENTTYTYDVASNCFTYLAVRRRGTVRVGRGSAMLAGWLRTTCNKENRPDDSEMFGGFVSTGEPEMLLIEFDLVVYSWNTSLIEA